MVAGECVVEFQRLFLGVGGLEYCKESFWLLKKIFQFQEAIASRINIASYALTDPNYSSIQYFWFCLPDLFWYTHHMRRNARSKLEVPRHERIWGTIRATAKSVRVPLMNHSLRPLFERSSSEQATIEEYIKRKLVLPANVNAHPKHVQLIETRKIILIYNSCQNSTLFTSSSILPCIVWVGPIIGFGWTEILGFDKLFKMKNIIFHSFDKKIVDWPLVSVGSRTLQQKTYSHDQATP